MTGNLFIGPFELIEWPAGLGERGRARHHMTLETVSIKTGSCLPLAREVHTLQAAAGGVGIPHLHWFEIISGKEVMITDSYGPTLEELFSESGRYFSVCTLLLLADQLLSRVEFIHSRNIVHGNLNPFSFALGSCEWQNQQVFLVDFCVETEPEPTPRDDLLAVGHILSYFYNQAQSWEQYGHKGHRSADMPVLHAFTTAIPSRGAVNYDLLRGIFREAYHDLLANVGLALDLKGPRAMGSGMLPRTGELSKVKTTALFDDLNSSLSHIGKSSSTPNTVLPPETWVGLLTEFNKALHIYMVLLCRDRASCEKAAWVMGAYHLPNRLWRDLRWFLKRINIAPESFRLAVIGKVYNFLAALYDAVPSYRMYWTEYLLIVARARKGLEPECGKAAWTRTIFSWQDVLNRLHASRSVLKQMR
ncbi:kinase-like domain-containing protein [Aspergillus undulatus]|uniref:kinase-like domain-containing protein n=1 Tax=Aspergillus undulatus TaxID=1810928 RepID=UPI003CCCC2D8